MSMRTPQQGEYLSSDRSGGRNQPEPYDAEALSLIDRSSYFEGTFRSSRDLRIEGEVRGTIECQGTLHVAQGAQVDAKVEAENITVAGELSGDINCRGRLQLMPSGRLRGKVSTGTLVINEGAFYEGELEMAPPDHSRRLGPPASAPRPLASIAGGGGERQTAAATGTSEPRGRGEQAIGPNSNTFIRRFGGQETAWSTDEEGGEDSEDGNDDAEE